MTLQLYNDWNLCDACGLPPRDNSKLKACTGCNSVAYHDAKCQKDHWANNGGHRRECKNICKEILPLKVLVQIRRRPGTGHGWWLAALEEQSRADCDRGWQIHVERWRRQDYRTAVEGFQDALRPLHRLWQGAMSQSLDSSSSVASETTRLKPNEASYGVQLARRLLFCAYCEADGGQISTCRQRLVQSVSILLEVTDVMGQIEEQTNRLTSETLDDAWMELMLSYEEVPELCRVSRHVANIAIQSGQSSCSWTNPLQRPGYMASIAGPCHSFVPREDHPDWCHVLEEHWKDIEKELKELESTQSMSWGAVGSGDRGSGGDDHRVVSKGGKWTEYVLFGTGSRQSDHDALFTKHLLRRYVPEAVSLAEAGGGEVIFSRLAPKTRIAPHCGPTNLRWTAHLGLVVPLESSGKCQIRVGSQWYRWQTGKFLLFDDSYEHEIMNDTIETRTILLLRLWHPALSMEQRRYDLEEACRRKELAVEKRFHPPD